MITPGASTMYANNLLGYSDGDDWYRVNVVSGQIITATITFDAYDGTGAAPSLRYEVLDQTGTNALGTSGWLSPSGVPGVFRWISNNTQPSVYYFHLFHNMSKPDLVHYSLRVQLDQQVDAGQAGDAGDTSGTARVITPGASTMYANNLLGFTDSDDWYRVNAVSGQIITATLTYDAYDGPAGNAPTLRYDVFDQTGTHSLAYFTLGGPSAVPAVYRWISSNTEPTAYYFHLSHNMSKPDLVHYSLQIQLDQQVDAGQLGDAGDDFNTARSVTLSSQSPSLNATHNLLGGSDSVDYYFIKLPAYGPV